MRKEDYDLLLESVLLASCQPNHQLVMSSKFLAFVLPKLYVFGRSRDLGAKLGELVAAFRQIIFLPRHLSLSSDQNQFTGHHLFSYRYETSGGPWEGA